MERQGRRFRRHLSVPRRPYRHLHHPRTLQRRGTYLRLGNSMGIPVRRDDADNPLHRGRRRAHLSDGRDVGRYDDTRPAHRRTIRIRILPCRNLRELLTGERTLDSARPRSRYGSHAPVGSPGTKNSHPRNHCSGDGAFMRHEVRSKPT